MLSHGKGRRTRCVVSVVPRALERSGHRVIKYDARAHGHSSPAESSDAYSYDLLADDALAARAVVRRLREGADLAFEIGEDAIASFTAKTIELTPEIVLVVHDTLPSAIRLIPFDVVC